MSRIPEIQLQSNNEVPFWQIYQHCQQYGTVATVSPGRSKHNGPYRYLVYYLTKKAAQHAFAEMNRKGQQAPNKPKNQSSAAKSNPYTVPSKYKRDIGSAEEQRAFKTLSPISVEELSLQPGEIKGASCNPHLFETSSSFTPSGSERQYPVLSSLTVEMRQYGDKDSAAGVLAIRNNGQLPDSCDSSLTEGINVTTRAPILSMKCLESGHLVASSGSRNTDYTLQVWDMRDQREKAEVPVAILTRDSPKSKFWFDVQRTDVCSV
ncbi:hypothetical protein BGX21_007891, partial [Mortierella sp. AD011]